MKSTIRSLAAPLTGLVVVLVLATTYEITMMTLGGDPSGMTIRLYEWNYAFLVAWGVELDRKVMGLSAPFEYAAFMFFLWVVLLPVYLFRTRRWRGLAVAVAVIAIAYIPFGIAYATWMAMV